MADIIQLCSIARWRKLPPVRHTLEGYLPVLLRPSLLHLTLRTGSDPPNQMNHIALVSWQVGHLNVRHNTSEEKVMKCH